jgi:Ca2+-transporting ATPase
MKAWSLTPNEVLKELHSSKDGLSQEEADRRIEKEEIKKSEGFADIFLKEVTEPMILLLLFIGVLYSFWGGLIDALTIFIVITILVIVEVWNEFNTKKIINSLKDLSSPTVIAIRNGVNVEIKKNTLVKGDVILLKSGNKVPADCRVLEANSLEVDESILTGESFPVEKKIEKISEETPVFERRNMVYAGTLIVNGSGKAVVVEVGSKTEIERIQRLSSEIKEPRTFIQLLMKKLVKIVLLISIIASFSVTVLAILEGQNIQKTILTGLSLAFATIPEELPIVIVIMLAVTAYTLTKRKLFVKNLRGLETLAGVTVIATDKTGTITQGRMSLEEVYTEGKLKKFSEFKSKELEKILEIGASVNDAVELENGWSGDPVDVEMQRLSKPKTKLERQFPLENGVLSQIRFNDKRFVFVKGAPEIILEKSRLVNGKKISDKEKRKVKKAIESMTEKGLRVIGFAYREIKSKEKERSEVEKNLNFVGLAGFIDPPRVEVKNAISNVEKAGVKVVMITGDHPLTAKTLAEKVGLKGGLITGSEIDDLSDEELVKKTSETSVYARITPEQKLRIVNALKKAGETIAMTGDGVNDALALKAADVGIALGKGSDVAKEASDIVLVDNDFSIIVEAIRQARKAFDNMQKGIKYYLACKTALILIFILPILFAIPLPLAPIQIILMELFMDLAASSAFVYEPEEEKLMNEKPKKLENFLDFKSELDIIKGGLSLFLAVSIVYFASLWSGASVAQARTGALFTWLLTHVLLAFNMKSNATLSKAWNNNKIVLLWAGAVFTVIAFLAFFKPSEFFISAISSREWVLVFACSIVFSFWIEISKIMKSLTLVIGFKKV